MKRQEATHRTEAPESGEETSPPVSLPGEAVQYMTRVREDPGDGSAWDELDEIARSTQKPDTVSSLYREALARDLSAQLVDELGQRAVAFHDEWFEDTTFVIAILRRVLELAAGADWAFE